MAQPVPGEEFTAPNSPQTSMSIIPNSGFEIAETKQAMAVLDR
jgi:hypothetical protein